MRRRERLISKKAFKKLAGKCQFCPEDDYDLLDVHRIVPGEEGGRYTAFNAIACCANCHRLIHSGKIKIDRKYLSTNGKWVLHYFDVHGDEHYD